MAFFPVNLFGCDFVFGACVFYDLEGSWPTGSKVPRVTFEAPKSNMIDSQGRLLPEVGDLFVAPVGWPEEALDPGPGDLLRYPHPTTNQVKGDRGRVMIVGGGPYHGAPLLAGMAAARMGVDLVHVAMPINAAQKAKWPSGLIYEKIDDEDIITDVTSLVKRCFAGRGVQSIVIGPGIGDDIATIGAVKMLIKSTPNIPKAVSYTHLTLPTNREV